MSKSKKLNMDLFIDLDDILKEEMKNPEFKKDYDYYGKQFEISF